MTYASLEHFRDVTSRNVLALQEAREKGRKVVGQFCIYSPLEIALAAGVPYRSRCAVRSRTPSLWRKRCCRAVCVP